MKFKISYASFDETNEREIEISSLDDLIKLSEFEGERYCNEQKKEGNLDKDEKPEKIKLVIFFPDDSNPKGLIVIGNDYLDGV